MFRVCHDNAGYSYDSTAYKSWYLEHVCSVFVVIMQDTAKILQRIKAGTWNTCVPRLS